MAGKDRKKQLARQRYERQEQARLAREARARRTKVIGVVAAVAVIAGGGTAIAMVSGGDEKKDDPAAKPSGDPSAQVGDGAPKQKISLTGVSLSGDEGGTASCKYLDSKDQGAPKNLGRPPSTAAYKSTVKGTIKTSLGDIGIELDGAKAPCTTNSFAFLAKKDYFNKTQCHRLTTGPQGSLRVLQCGDPSASGSGGPGYRFANENTKGAKYTRGTLAMAHSQQPDSNGSQFFIVWGDSTDLPADYTVFGKITSGMNVVDQVAKAGAAAQ